MRDATLVFIKNPQGFRALRISFYRWLSLVIAGTRLEKVLFLQNQAVQKPVANTRRPRQMESSGRLTDQYPLSILKVFFAGRTSNLSIFSHTSLHLSIINLLVICPSLFSKFL